MYDETVLERLKVEKIENKQAWPYLIYFLLPIHASTICFGTEWRLDPNTDPQHMDIQGASIDIEVHYVRLLEKELCFHAILPVQLQVQEFLLAEQAYSRHTALHNTIPLFLILY